MLQPLFTATPPRPRRSGGPEPHSDFFQTRQLSATYDGDTRAIWLRLRPQPRPSFNPELLRDLARYCDALTATGGTLHQAGEARPIEAAILASATPGVFNLGGDLALFHRLIETRDRAALTRYGRACIEVLHRNYLGHDLPLRTISLVQGECLGGGFEAALSSDMIVAERSSRFGFPEILFNLFPGMGACSFLERRCGRQTAETIISSGRIYSAAELHDLGAIDHVVDDGAGELAIARLLREQRRIQNGLTGLARARRRVQPIEFRELADIVDIWVDSALRISARDLRLMQRLVGRQDSLTVDDPCAQAVA